jgi:hypothetical protein
MPLDDVSMNDERWDPSAMQVIRIDFAVDGAGSLGDAAAGLRDLAAQFEEMERQGWKVQSTFRDGCAQIVRG